MSKILQFYTSSVVDKLRFFFFKIGGAIFVVKTWLLFVRLMTEKEQAKLNSKYLVF